MLYKLRQRAKDERGFTLIELLVVILIIGILAAIAIPSFLSQTSKANDAGAKELAYTAETTADTYGTDNNNDFAGLTQTVLAQYESTINTSGNQGGGAYISAAGPLPTSNYGYSITATSSNGDEFTIQRSTTGTVTRTCTGVNGATVASGQTVGGCVSGTW